MDQIWQHSTTDTCNKYGCVELAKSEYKYLVEECDITPRPELCADLHHFMCRQEQAKSMFTGVEEPCGMADGRYMVARELTAGGWTWHGFDYTTLEEARAAARKAGY